MNVILSINKDAVFNDVAQTTSYIGAKMDDTMQAYERIFTTDDDKEKLMRFWDDSENLLCTNLKRFLVSEQETGSNANATYNITLSLSSSFDIKLTRSIQNAIFSYFVASIVAKWFTITNKDEAAGYATEAAAHLEDALSKIYYKNKPQRPVLQPIGGAINPNPENID